MIISLILYKTLKMKEYKGFVYRYNKKGALIISRNPIDCALDICSPSGVVYYKEIERLSNANRTRFYKYRKTSCRNI